MKIEKISQLAPIIKALPRNGTGRIYPAWIKRRVVHEYFNSSAFLMDISRATGISSPLIYRWKEQLLDSNRGYDVWKDGGTLASINPMKDIELEAWRIHRDLQKGAL